MRDARARPKPALIDQRQQSGVHQGGLARAAVAVDLQPADGPIVGRGVEAGQGVQGLLLAAEEEVGLIDAKGVEPDEGAAVERNLVAGKRAARPDLLEHGLRQRVLAVPRRGLEELQEGRQAVRADLAEQDGEDRETLSVVARAEVADEGNLGLRSDPAAHPIASDQDDEGATAADGPLEQCQPLIARADARVVLEDSEPEPLHLRAQSRGGLQVVAAVAQKDLVVVRHKQTLRRNASNPSNRLEG